MFVISPCQFYANIGREISQTFTQNNSKEIEHFYRITPTVQDPSYDRDALLKQLRKINPHKASGPDSVTSRELKILQGSIVNSLEIILKSSFQQSVFPSCWKIARIKSSFKKGKKQERTNYRPLSMLSIPSKLLESQICNTVDSHLDDNKIVTDLQWGFIKGRSTEGILLKLTEIWKKSVDNGLIVGIVFIDFQKAFDTVPHEILSYKLQAAGIPGNLHALIMNYLKDRTQYAEINGECSSTKHVRFGVPQGSLLGPKLYSLHVNDLPSAITQGEMYLFADDTTVYCTGKDLESVVDTLNTIMDEIYGWCIWNKLKVHPGKCEAMFMMRSPFIGPMRPILYGGDHIKIVQESTCLGLRIDNRLDWKSQVHNACKTFSKKLGALKRLRRLPTKVLEEIYYTTIIARTTYCISVWGNCSEAIFNMMEDNHARAAKLIHNLPRNLSNEESLARANWQPISFLYKRRLLTLMHQIYHGTADKSIAQMFQKKGPEKQRTRNKLQFEVKDIIQRLGEIVSRTRQQ